MNRTVVNCSHLKNRYWYQCCTVYHGFILDPDPAFFLNADQDPGSETNANPYVQISNLDPGPTLPSLKVRFFHEKYT